jgi:hypothetical protein
MKQTYENNHAVNVNYNIFNGNTTINHYHIITITPSRPCQSKETIQNHLQLDHGLARFGSYLMLQLQLQHVHCQTSSGDDSSYEGDCSEFNVAYSFMFCIASHISLQYSIITRNYCRPC